MSTLGASVKSVPEYLFSNSFQASDSIALVAGRERVTFAELLKRANRVAGYLRSRGVASGDTVGILLERSIDWIVAALAIMRLGAAYLPLDPNWPDDRVQFALADSGAVLLITSVVTREALQGSVPLADMRRDAQAITAAGDPGPLLIAPESLAYVIYTSGSTGRPKGVEITNANLLHLVRWHAEAFHVTPADRASHLAGLGFDAAVWELWPNLCAGATVCLIEDEIRSSPRLMQDWIVDERITIAFVPTVHAGPLMAMSWPTTTALRTMLTGGDALQSAPVDGLPFKVVNNYGPTECTVVATSCEVKPSSHTKPPIGRAILGAAIYLLDEHGTPVAPGNIGEIFIGGDGVGRGYRKLPQETERLFLPDPFAERSGGRMYRTGDRARLMPNGELEFCGRLDRQTKIRGQRVELDEIDYSLTQHGQIDFSITTVDATPEGNVRLVAHVKLADSNSEPSREDLDNHLKQRLPDYMIPYVYVRLKDIPVSYNGKIDLTKLPAVSEYTRLGQSTSAEPATAAEERVLHMVRELLHNQTLGPEDNFFLAGGHSLLGMQLLMSLRDVFGVDLTLRELFEAPTVRRLAAHVEATLTAMIMSMSDEEAKVQLGE